jgi:ABC-type multidrug transport system ATPase subunit
MIKKRRDNGKLIILSCHDSSLIEELADKIYYMKAGELI